MPDWKPGWHPDHIQPHSKNGETEVTNGQALCPHCNLKKESSKLTRRYNDSFKPRPFQDDLIQAVISRNTQGKRFTVAWAGPGTEKILGYQAVGITLLRDGLIDWIAAYTPRTSLAQQCELEYSRQRDYFDPKGRFDKILHKINNPPFTIGTRVGYGSTNAALCAAPNLHLRWAQEHAGRFLLVVDEAQFGGCDDTDRALTGTAAAANIEALCRYAAHTLVLTGTPYRSDKAQIVLAEYREDQVGNKKIVYHVRARYKDGISQEYLRSSILNW